MVEKLTRAPNSQASKLQGRLPDTDRHALTVLAAGSDARIECQIVADHRHLRQGIRPVADQRRTLDRRGDPAVLDQIGLARRKDELA